MERAAWTNERLDDLAESMRSGFVRVDQEFGRVHQDIRDLRTELHDSVGALRTEMREEFRSLHTLLLRIGGGIIIGLIGVIAAILARGA